MPNRLSKESSPYLLQHQHNPVDWYPWGPEAIERARIERKPILLSIGYSACHWCHVMERESFENPEIASLMNQDFINIKVDREERPDLDQIYQNVAQALTGGGGWPLTVFLTPDLKPFYGGTYFPPEDRYGRPGFGRILSSLSEAFKNSPEAVAQNVAKLMEVLASFESVKDSGVALPEAGGLKSAAEMILNYIDWENGGIGGSPKFPNVMLFSYLWRIGCAMDLPDAKRAVLVTLEQMAWGGIYDQLGGGFHRYSVDEFWEIPHFEKMLYDNALFLRLYSEVILSQDPAVTSAHRKLFSEVVCETVTYVLSEMRSPQGGFYSSQDADSEGEEGQYFAWTPKELQEVLTPEESLAFSLRYGVNDEGNFEDGKSVLKVDAAFDEISKKTGISDLPLRELVLSSREKLFAIREKRVRPARDEKILTSWNALMISGLTWASKALFASGEVEAASRSYEAAQDAYDFLKSRVGQSNDRLLASFQGGQAKLNAYLDDYAFIAMAALDLARSESDADRIGERIRDSKKWLSVIIQQFKDPGNTGYFFTSIDHEDLILRPKTVFDQAIPSGTSLALSAMLAISELGETGTQEENFQLEAIEQLKKLYLNALRSPHGQGELLCAALLFVQGPIALSGPGAARFCTDPQVFQKKPTEILQLCHRQTCKVTRQDQMELELVTARNIKV